MLCIRPFILNSTFLLSSEYFKQMHFCFLTVRRSFPRRLRDRKKNDGNTKNKTKKTMFGFLIFRLSNRRLNFELQSKSFSHHSPSPNYIITFIITINYWFNIEHQRSQSSWQNLKTLKQHEHYEFPTRYKNAVFWLV